VGVLLNADNASLNWPTGQLDDPPPPMLSLRIEENVSPRYNSASSSVAPGVDEEDEEEARGRGWVRVRGLAVAGRRRCAGGCGCSGLAPS
jgi:hypothetical protein